MTVGDAIAGNPVSRRRVIAAGLGAVAAAPCAGAAQTPTVGATPVAEGRGRPTGEGEGMLTDVPGFLVGHATLAEPITGCTVVLCPKNTVGGVEIRGGWTGTREMEILSSLSTSPFVDALLLTGAARSVWRRPRG